MPAIAIFLLLYATAMGLWLNKIIIIFCGIAETKYLHYKYPKMVPPDCSIVKPDADIHLQTYVLTGL